MLKSEKKAFHQTFTESVEDVLHFERSTVPAPSERHENLKDGGIRIDLLDSELWFECFKRVASPGFSTALFAARFTRYDYVSETYVNSGWLIFSGKHAFTTGAMVNYYGTLSEATAQLAHWLREVVPPFRTEMSTPDSWASTSVLAPVGQINQNDDDRPLTPEEQARLHVAVDELREHIFGTFDLLEQQRLLIETSLTRLSDAVITMNRQAWITFAIGTVATIGSALLLNNEQGRQLWEAARDILNRALLALN